MPSSTSIFDSVEVDGVPVAGGGSSSSAKLRASNLVGYGSGTKIPRFTSLDENTGAAYWTYTGNDATFGTKITILEDGVYAGMIFAFGNGSSQSVGWTLNEPDAQNNNSPYQVTDPYLLVGNYITGNTIGDASFVWPLVVGDIIRPHTDGYDNNSIKAFIKFCRIGA